MTKIDIDLEAHKIRLEQKGMHPIGAYHSDIRDLIGYVEVLRERVAELESDNDAAIKWQQFYMKKAEVAEASNLVLRDLEGCQ